MRERGSRRRRLLSAAIAAATVVGRIKPCISVLKYCKYASRCEPLPGCVLPISMRPFRRRPGTLPAPARRGAEAHPVDSARQSVAARSARCPRHLRPVLRRRQPGSLLADPDRPVPGEMRFVEWREVSGVRFPSHRVNYHSGAKRGEAVTKTIAVNSGLRRDDLAAKPGDFAPQISD